MGAPSELLRFTTAGSVDDGKSTLIGRLLYDTKAMFDDQLQDVEAVSKRRGDARVDLALLTDGLRAEREQGITIDVAYRYFATRRRKFIIADTPGHVQYTRNMVTGASTTSLAIVLVDARRGITEQSRRHAFIASLLRIPHLIFAVNKMDLVGWDEAVFERLKDELGDLAARLDIQDVVFIPISALTGANVVSRSAEMPWYDGPTLLYQLDNVYITGDHNMVDVRLPIQWVIRPQSSEHPDYRGYAGQVAGGVLRAGDEVMVQPSGLATTITKIESAGREVEAAFPPMSVVVHLRDDLDVGRGDMLCRPHNQPTVGQDLDAIVCWFADRPLRPGARYAIKHTTRWSRAVTGEVLYRLDVNTGHRELGAPELRTNDLGRVRFRAMAPIAYDSYRRNHVTGSFILVDEQSNATVAAGMLVAE